MKRLPTTPHFFTVSALDYDHDQEASEPLQWQTFLNQILQDDVDCWQLLREWFGYCLTGDTSQQKILLIVGPKRSGKGTIARVLSRLIGQANVCGPTTSSLAGSFGLQPLIGKTLAIVSDARFSGKDVPTVVERLLCISGEDALTIDRKHMTSVTMKLPTRFVFLTNELPRLKDTAGALSGRFMILRLTESFYGREDKGLTGRLLEELPAILNWSIEGWLQLQARGHFVQPASAEDALRDLEDLSSPVGAFVRERCDVGSRIRVTVNDIFQAWKVWCEGDGRGKASTKQVFGRDLVAAVPGIKRRTGTDGRFYEGIALKREFEWSR
jgi:putative DNA primase/helicase